MKVKISFPVFLASFFIIMHLAGCNAEKRFTLWQLPSQVNTIGNSYVIKSNGGKVVVIDGGTASEESYLRGFIGALGNEVELWIVSHPHDDHMGALTNILEKPNDIIIKRILHSALPDSIIRLEEVSQENVYKYDRALHNSGIDVVNITEPGLQFDIDEIKFKILGVANPEFTTNPYNNSSCIIRVWDNHKSFVFLGDAGVECGNKVLESPFVNDLNCDYLQMAHHGQQGCDENFYKTVNFHTCLWSTPTWVWENNNGGGPGSGNLTTMDTRKWMDEKGIRKHYISWQGLAKIK